ncbi:hypothetical protein ZOSMA_2529G00010 [Zostera marina]|uniref:Uncharacterized protein n=1 Tax=Zostera marina TaxID=29655 RepID=A0A0K9PI46_ZOSMR|nr:hypothetical protein ZOSMA_2529G00010 [Zostera marina]
MNVDEYSDMFYLQDEEKYGTRNEPRRIMNIDEYRDMCYLQEEEKFKRYIISEKV